MATAVAPVLKWPGSKRAISGQLARLAPPSERLIDPFVGGGAMLAAIQSPSSLAGDVIPELIQLWHEVQQRPGQLAADYELRWQRLQSEGHLAYYEIRESFNRTRSAADFLFLTRTCVNGLVRFNARGDFNNSLHHTRPGIHPGRLRALIALWSRLVARTTFACADYRETLAHARKGDFVFLDPPYGGTRGRYLTEGVDLTDLYGELERLNRRGITWMMTFDGTAGDRIYDSAPPPTLYKSRLLVATGHSPFTRLMKTSLDEVSETVYLNFDVAREVVAEHAESLEQGGRGRATHEVHNDKAFDRIEGASDGEVELPVVEEPF